jgi:hypothetical protein
MRFFLSRSAEKKWGNFGGPDHRQPPGNREKDLNLSVSVRIHTGFIPAVVGEASNVRYCNLKKLEKEGHMRQAKYWVFLLPLLLILACASAFAQANSDVTGIVTDQNGAVVPAVSVTLTEPATGYARTDASSSTGLFDFAGLNPGTYSLKVVAKGFETYVQNGITVNTSSLVRADVKLTLGAQDQTVTVSADALTVQTDSNVVSTLITSEEISEIATENRNFAALAALGLGVSSALPDNNTPVAFGANFTISINGLRETHNIWLIDGGESDDRGGGGGMQIQPSQDAIAEFTMLTSNYPPDYGISSGATISLSLKSGTKKFHGTLWEENRNTDYDARKYLDGARATIHYNIYGWNVGGPLYIPHVYNSNKNKTFFFWNEEWRKTESTASSNNATLDPADKPVSGTDLNYVSPKYAASPIQLIVPNVTNTAQFYTGAPGSLGGAAPNVGLAALGYTLSLTNGAPAGLATPPTVAQPRLTALPGPGACWNGTTTWANIADAPGPPDVPAHWGNAVCDPTVASQVIPHQLFDPNAVIYLNAGILPAPTNLTTDHNVASVPLPLTDRDDIVRIDHNFTDKWAILGHYIGDGQNQAEGQPELGWCGCNYNTLTSTLTSPAHSAAIKLSGTVSPNLLVEASINYDGNGANITPSANTFLPSTWTVQAVVPAYAITRKIWPGMGWDSSLPNGSGGGISEDTATEPYHNAAQDYEPKVDVSYTLGQHAFKFGFSFNRYTKNQMLYGDEQGNYGFNSKTNDTLMDTLLGLANSYSQDLVAPIRHYAENTTSGYAQDNWHVSPRLTLQLGLRYDALPHAWERNNLLGNFNQATYLTGRVNAPIWDASGAIDPTSPHLYEYAGISSYINGTQLAGQEHTPIGVVTNDYNTLQPRIGFSEDVFGNGKTVIRGGFGTFYERLQGNDIFNVATSAPFNPSLNVGSIYFSQPGFNWNTGQQIAPTSLIFAGGSGSLAQSYKAPGVAMYSLGVQREIKPSIIWVVQYVGNLAWHQNIGNNALNALPTNIGRVNIAKAGSFNYVDARCVAGDGGDNYTGDAACKAGFSNNGGMNAYRSYPGYAGIEQDENTTNGSYNGFQTAVRVQNRWGLSGEVDYTYSHEIDITSYDRTNVDNPWNLKYDKGSGQLDRRQILSANYIYKLPIFQKSTGLVKSIAGGWEIAGTIVDETGVPLTLGLNTDYDPVGLGGGYSNHPNITNPGVKMTYAKKINNWFDATRIDNNVTPVWAGGANLGFGNFGKDAIVQPGRVNFTTSLYKSFAIVGSAKFELRFESFNTFNHTEWNSVNVTSNQDGAGVSSNLNGTYDARSLELGGKFTF